LLYRAKRVVVIGDPKQLRHISSISDQQDTQLLEKYSLLEGHARFAYATMSLFDLANATCGPKDIVALRDHHRSHSHIIEFSNQEYYEGRLRVATKYDRLKTPTPNQAAVRWIDIRGSAVRPVDGGAMNEEEAKAVIREIARLVEQGYRGTIGVVSPFRAQANRIRELAAMSPGLAGKLAEMDFLADTVHKFQGDERDVMFFSPVVSNGISKGAVGFLNKTGNLFNVAVTRARAALVVVGDRSAILSGGIDYLSKYSKYVSQLSNDQVSRGVERHAELGPEYPPVSNPENVSDWERVLYREMYRAGIRAIPQYNVEKFVLDFAVIEGDRKLNIEVDGERYHRNWDGELCRRDQIRNQRLMELGWDVKRFWVYQVRDDTRACIAWVTEWMRTEMPCL
jgi:very-short-patch-repair endonuclease